MHMHMHMCMHMHMHVYTCLRLQLLQLLAHVACPVGSEALEEARGRDAGRYGDAAEQRALQLPNL